MGLFGSISKELSRWNTKGRNLILNISKKADSWWPRLTQEKVKNELIKIDWARWVDSDGEEDDQPVGGMGEFDPNKMQTFDSSDGKTVMEFNLVNNSV